MLSSNDIHENDNFINDFIINEKKDFETIPITERQNKISLQPGMTEKMESIPTS